MTCYIIRMSLEFCAIFTGKQYSVDLLCRASMALLFKEARYFVEDSTTLLCNILKIILSYTRMNSWIMEGRVNLDEFLGNFLINDMQG